MEERKSAAITRRKEGNVNAAPTAPMAPMSMAPTAPITMSMAPTTDTGKDISRLETLPSSPALLPPCISIVIIDRRVVWAGAKYRGLDVT